MSDVVVNVVESATNLTVTEQDVAVDVTETVVEVSVSTAGIQGVPGANNDPTYVTVRNATGATLPKGTIVYISGANGNNVQVTPAIATSDATSARTLGWLSAAIANNASGLCMVEGYLEGINTQSFNAGDQLYLSGTVAGGFTATKPQAPIHLVYVGVVTKKSAGDGHVFVKVQNGYELEELHDVRITSPANNDVLTYDSATDLWINKVNAADGVTSITATAPLTGGTITSTGSIGLNQAALSITKSQVSDFTSGTVTSASTAQQSGTAVYAVNSGTAVYSTTSGTALTITGDITKSQVTDFTSGTVVSAGTAQQSGTAVYSVSSGTAVSISGSITQSQVTNLITDLAAKANLAGGNAFTEAQTITGSVISDKVLVVKGASGQTANLFEVQDSTGTFRVRINQVGNSTFAGNITSQNNALFTPFSAATIPLSVQGAASQSANLQEWRDSSGNILSRISQLGSFVTPVSGSFISGQTGQAFFAVSSPANVVTVIRGAASQSANLLEIQSSAGTILSRISSSGQFVSDQQTYIGSGATSITNTRFNVATGSASVVGAVIRAAASQTANLFEIQDSSGNNLVSINPAGRYFSTQRFSLGDTSFTGFMTLLNTNGGIPTLLLKNAAVYNASQDQVVYQQNTGTVLGGRNANAQIYTGSTAPATTSTGGATTAASGDGTTATITTTSAHSLAVGDRVTVAGVTPTGYNGTYIIASTPTTTTFTYTNATTGSQTVAGTVRVDAQASIVSRSAATVGLLVRGAASQAANIFEIQNSGGSSQVTVTSAGNLIAIGQARVGTGTSLGQLSVVSASAGTLGAVIRGAASQSANLLELQNSAGSNLVTVSSAGLVSGNAADATLATAATGLGYMGLPQNSTTTGSYTIVAADAGEHIYASATRTVTIPANSALALPIGTTLTFIAGAGATMTIAITTDTMYLAGAGTTGSRTLAAHGIATAVKTTATTWLISGNGLT